MWVWVSWPPAETNLLGRCGSVVVTQTWPASWKCAQTRWGRQISPCNHTFSQQFHFFYKYKRAESKYEYKYHFYDTTPAYRKVAPHWNNRWCPSSHQNGNMICNMFYGLCLNKATAVYGCQCHWSPLLPRQQVFLLQAVTGFPILSNIE